MASADLYIDLEAVATNWLALSKMSGKAVTTGATVKANAYGLGAAKVARRLAAAGCRIFFVATAEEGADLRTALGPGPQINVFSGHMTGDTGAIRQARLTPMLNSIDQLTRHLEALPGHSFGLQLDTGMNRLGLEMPDWAAVAELALRARPTLVMSHLACADDPNHPMNARQLAAFHEMTDGITVPRSLSATGGILLGPDYHFNVTRPGIGLYGGAPYTQASPAVRLSLPVIQCRDVAVGETVGYANAWTAKAPSRIATVASGYADGLLRSLSGQAMLYSGPVACKLAGRVSMDLLTVDISHLDADPDHLDILCDHQGVDALAEIAGTIGYEILTGLGPRYERRYRGDGA